jgi:hypothetical protein
MPPHPGKRFLLLCCVVIRMQLGFQGAGVARSAGLVWWFSIVVMVGWTVGRL